MLTFQNICCYIKFVTIVQITMNATLIAYVSTWFNAKFWYNWTSSILDDHPITCNFFIDQTLYEKYFTLLTVSSRFWASSHASNGRKNSSKGSADNRDVFPRVINFTNFDDVRDAPRCMKSLKRKVEKIKRDGNWKLWNKFESTYFFSKMFSLEALKRKFHQSIMWKVKYVQNEIYKDWCWFTSIIDLLPSSDRNRMCAMDRCDLPTHTAPHKFEIEGWLQWNILYSLDPISHDT